MRRCYIQIRSDQISAVQIGCNYVLHQLRSQTPDVMEQACMFLQVKHVLSPEGFLYMVTVMDNKPTEILELLAEDGIKGSYFQSFALGVTWWRVLSIQN